ncbi:MAG: MMPL family transporter [Myxococcales bacterium]|nr:MMPL family transporter [Myxococcales bacterium]
MLIRPMTFAFERCASATRWLAGKAIRWPRSCLAIVGAVTLVLAAYLPKLQFYVYEDGNAAPDSPALIEYSRFLQTFGTKETVLVVFGCKPWMCESVLEPQVLDLVDRLSNRILAIDRDYIQAALSLTTFPEVRVTDDEMVADLLVRREGGRWPPVEEVRRRVTANGMPMLHPYIVSEDFKTTAILVDVSLFLARTPAPPAVPAVNGHLSPHQAVEMRTAVIKAIDRAVESERRSIVAKYGHEPDLYLSGFGVTAVLMGEDYVRSSISVMAPVMIGMMALVLWTAFRSVRGTIYPLFTAAVPTVWTLGIMAWMGRPASFYVPIIPSLLLVLGIPDSVHLVSRYFERRKALGDAREASLAAVAGLVRPCLMTSLTTAGALLSLAVSSLPPVRDFGVFGALGVMLAYVFDMVVLPVLLLSMPIPARYERSQTLGAIRLLLEPLARFTTRSSANILFVSLVTTAIFATGIWKLRVDNAPFQLVKENSYLARGAKFIERNLGYPTMNELTFHASEPDGFLDPALLREVDEAARLLRAEPMVRQVISATDYLAWLYGKLDQGAEPPGSLPPTRAGVAELVLLLETTARPILQSWASEDYADLRVTVESPMTITFEEAVDLQAHMRRLLSGLLGTEEGVPPQTGTGTAAAAETSGDGRPRITGFTITGGAPLLCESGIEMLRTLRASFAISFLIVYVMLSIWVRSFRFGLLCMIPNFFPAVLILGYMGHGGIYLDLGTIVIASLIIGIAVDDTIHWTHAFIEEFGRGAMVTAAVRRTFARVGVPMIFSSVVLAAGFLVWSFSAYPSLAYFGLISALGIAGALVGDLIILPAVVHLFPSWVPRAPEEDPA